MAEVTFQATILKHLTKTVETLMEKHNPEKQSNTGKVLAQAFMWDLIATYAKKQSENVWKQMEQGNIVSYKGLQPGQYTLAESSRFFVTDTVSQPRKTFTPGVLASTLKSRYKIPEAVSREMIEAAKIAGNSSHTCSIVER